MSATLQAAQEVRASPDRDHKSETRHSPWAPLVHVLGKALVGDPASSRWWQVKKDAQGMMRGRGLGIVARNQCIPGYRINSCVDRWMDD